MYLKLRTYGYHWHILRAAMIMANPLLPANMDFDTLEHDIYLHRAIHSAQVVFESLREVVTSNIGSVVQFPFQSYCSSVRKRRL